MPTVTAPTLTSRLIGLKRAELLCRAKARRAGSDAEAVAYLALARKLRRVRRSGQAVARR